MRRFCVCTGSRSEYGILKPVMEAIARRRNLKLQVVAAGMHLSDEFGYTVRQIRRDGFKIGAVVPMNPETDSGYSMAQAVGRGVLRFANRLKRLRPDILLVLGDRIEPLAAAIAAAYMNIPVAHIHGGDITKAGLDESVRHAISKIAHIHFAATRKSANRLIRMGEDKRRIYLSGAPCIDSIIRQKYYSLGQIRKKLRIDLEKALILLVQHPVTTQSSLAKRQMVETLEALRKLKINTVVIYPNSDAGGRKIIKVIRKYSRLPFIYAYKSLEPALYKSLMKTADVMVGNSSSGIIESASFKLPVVNVGIRQFGRERAGNIIDVPHNRGKIARAIEKALFDKRFRNAVRYCRSPYGKGNASLIIAKTLSKIKIDENLLQKHFSGLARP